MTEMSRQELLELLPFYANDSLDEYEQLAIESALETDPALRSEADYLATLCLRIQDTTVPSAGDLPLQRAKRKIAQARGSVAPPWWKPALAVAASLVVVQWGIMIYWSAEFPTGYQPLSASNGTTLSVQFADGVTAVDIQQLLEAKGLQIIKGPTGPGLYLLRSSREDLSETEIERLVSELQSEYDIFIHVQRD